MRIIPQCIPCIFDDVLEALALLGASGEDADAIIAEGLRRLSGRYGAADPPSYYITEMHRIIKRRLNIAIPFAGLRDVCLTSCKEIARTAARRSRSFGGEEKLRFLIRWAIAANTLDFRTAGAGYGLAHDRIEKMLSASFDAGLAVDHCGRIAALLFAARNIVYVPDNVGELRFDKLLIGECVFRGASVTVPFRGGPITSDAVLADGEAAGLSEVAQSIIVSGPDTLGISFAEMTAECVDALNKADVIIAKGQANFYVFSEFGERFPRAAVISLFSAKCAPVARLFGHEGKINIAAVIREASEVSGRRGALP
jgi:uncharacterized protein with ATP-grasp and redox domains